MKGFAIYKQSLDSILENSFKNKKEFKKNLSVIMGALKYSNTLKEFFTLYNEIENKNYNNIKDGENYLNEAINHLKNQKTELKKVTSLLDKIIEKRKDLVEIKENTHYTNLDKIIFETNIKHLDTVIECKSNLVENMVNRKSLVETKPIDPKILSMVINKNYKKEYENSLTESQQNILKNTLLMDGDTLTKEFTNVKEIALKRINNLISESKDDSLSAKLVQTKDKIKTFSASKKSYIRVRGLLEDLN
mgnify:CR=1 FL=1|jgi:hypothetical protein|tara:strand:- start:268 stop:1011 length:744 start_codon:yes stop_codon:yes gene_type:complete